ncbi:glycosyltransferase family 25 protein [Hyaloscypha variabilis]
MPAFKPRRRSRFQSLCYFVFGLGFVLFLYYYALHEPRSAPDTVAKEAASNSTLGFQKILVLSKSPSWRTRGLKAASAYTGLDIEIPVQSLPTDEFIQLWRKLGDPNGKHPGLGQAYNWIAHLDLVKYAIALDLETVLILEDDVDWDVTIKQQMQLISSAVREFTFVDDEDETPYGKSWDILWIGHSGDPLKNETRRVEFKDPSVPSKDQYTGWTKPYYNLNPGSRYVQRAVNPVGTIGYAMTKRGMKKVALWAGKGENEAYDIRLLEGCRSKDLSCIVVNPQLMHHYVPPMDFGHISEVAGVNGAGSKAEEEDFEKLMGSTPNIVQSTRCRVLFGSTCLRK